MIVKIKKQTGSLLLEGEYYEAQRYWLDPMEKVTLLCKLDPVTLKPVEVNHSMCNEYISNIEIINMKKHLNF